MKQNSQLSLSFLSLSLSQQISQLSLFLSQLCLFLSISANTPSLSKEMIVKQEREQGP